MKHIKIDEQSGLLLLAALFSLLLLENGMYLFFITAVVFLLLYMLQQPLKPAVFSLIVLQHFMQISAGVWLCIYLGKEMNYNTSSRTTATIVAVIGLAFLMAPIIYYQSKLPQQTLSSLRSYAEAFSTKKTIYAYLISLFVTSALTALAFGFSGLTQVIFSVVKIKWILFLLMGFQCFLKNEYKKIFFFIVAIEFASGLFSFFSEFKTVIYFLIILSLTFIEKLNPKQLLYMTAIGVWLIAFGLFWTNIKGEYRAFINTGTNNQAVMVEKDAAYNKLYDLGSNINDDKLEGSVVQMLDRVQYTYHLAKTIDRVPAVLPFENGNNWLESLSFATTPRYLNPNKPEYDATAKTVRYTGLRYSGRDKGVSFSLGYFADSYIDFGLWGMMGVLLALGTLYGVLYNFLLRKSTTNLIFNYAVVGAFFMEFNALEMDSTYILGRLFANTVTFLVMIQFLFPLVMEFITIKAEKEPALIFEMK